MNLHKKIFVFRNSTEPVAAVNQFVAVSEDGYTLAACYLTADQANLYRIRMGKNSVYGRLYKKHCPKGYELIFIDDINLPEYDRIRANIQKTNRKRAEQREKENHFSNLIKAKIDAATQDANLAAMESN